MKSAFYKQCCACAGAGVGVRCCSAQCIYVVLCISVHAEWQQQWGTRYTRVTAERHADDIQCSVLYMYLFTFCHTDIECFNNFVYLNTDVQCCMEPIPPMYPSISDAALVLSPARSPPTTPCMCFARCIAVKVEHCPVKTWDPVLDQLVRAKQSSIVLRTDSTWRFTLWYIWHFSDISGGWNFDLLDKPSKRVTSIILFWELSTV